MAKERSTKESKMRIECSMFCCVVNDEHDSIAKKAHTASVIQRTMVRYCMPLYIVHLLVATILDLLLLE